MRLILSLLLGACAYAQAAGSVSYTAPTPGKLTVSAGVETCVLTGNAVPATAVSIACVVNGVTIPAYTIPLAAGASFTFDYHYNGDAITVMLISDAAGKISYDAAATPNGGQQATGKGSF